MKVSLERQVKLGNIKKGILLGLAMGAVVSVGVIAPNALKIFKPLIKKHRSGKYNFWRSLKKLEKDGFVEMDVKGNYFVTDKGSISLNSISPELIKKQIRWDKKWRVIIFDIPKGREKTRQRLRNTIQAYGFIMLQKSVWIYPYPCEDLITLLKGELRLGKQLLYMVVDALEGDKQIKDHFRL